jgi:hypothetical protein
MTALKSAQEFFNLAKKLDELINIVREETDARAALVLVLDEEGHIHFTVQGAQELVADLPELLVLIADRLYDDLIAKSKH